ncbi:MAG: hypothetical protein R6X35_08610 [Candidatus Krumholzibacteriia bacterium]
MTMNLSKAAAALVALLAAASAAAAPQLATGYGDQWAWRGADANAMGGTGVTLYRGGLSNLFNPAMLALETGTRLDAGLSVDQESEDRFQPLFDSFDSWVTDAAIASGRNHFWQAGFGAAHRLPVGPVPVTAGLSLSDRYPFQYRFTEELRNPDPFPSPNRDAVLEIRERELDGTLRTLSLGFGAELHERVSAGFAAHYAFGTITDTWRVRDFDDAVGPGDDSYEEIRTRDVDGINVTFGLRGVVTERVEIGLAWESRLKTSGDFSVRRTEAEAGLVADATAAGHVKYPDIYRAGLAFRPRTDPATVLAIELEYMPWDQTEDTAAGPAAARLNDTVDVRVGVQHTFYNGVPVRFGFRHYESYADREATASAFSGGVGLPFGQGLFSVSVELTKLSGILDHQFPYSPGYWGDQYEADPQARVEDTRFRIGAGYTLNF